MTLAAEDPLYAHLSDDRLLDAWVFSAGNALVDCVWARGTQRVTGGRHHDHAKLAQGFQKAMKRLWN